MNLLEAKPAIVQKTQKPRKILIRVTVVFAKADVSRAKRTAAPMAGKITVYEIMVKVKMNSLVFIYVK